MLDFEKFFFVEYPNDLLKKLKVVVKFEFDRKNLENQDE